MVRQTLELSGASPDFCAGLNEFIGNLMSFQSFPIFVFETVLIGISEFCLKADASPADVVVMTQISYALLRSAPEGLHPRVLGLLSTNQQLQGR